MSLCLCVTLLDSRQWILYLKLGLKALVSVVLEPFKMYSLVGHLKALMCFQFSRHNDRTSSLWSSAWRIVPWLKEWCIQYEAVCKVSFFRMETLHQERLPMARDSTMTCLSFVNLQLTKSWFFLLGNNRRKLSIEQYDCIMNDAQPLGQLLVNGLPRCAASQATPCQ